MTRRFLMLLCISLLAGLTPIPGISSVNAASVDFADVEAFFDHQMQTKLEELHIPNAAVAVVADGKVILEKGYGYANREEQIPVDPEKSLFRIGSTSKLFTWTAVMQLAEQGLLDLNSDVNQYLDFTIPAKLAFSSGKSEPAPITLAHLMTHTAGFEDYSGSIFRLSPTEVVPLQQYIKSHLPSRIFPPGEIIAYSNYGTALAGYIVERVSGLPYSQYMEQHIYSPLGMNNSSFRQPLPAELSSGLVQGYRYVEGEYSKGEFEFIPESAGGMSSTAADMAKFMLAYLQDGSTNSGRILSEETVRQMRSRQFTQHPDLEGMAYGFIEGNFNARRVLFHSGSTMLFDTGFYLLPEEKTGVFITYSGSDYFVHKQIFQAFLDRYYPSSHADPAALPPAGTKERSAQYIGEYHQNRKSFTTSEKFVSLTMGMIHIAWDNEGYLLVNHAGDTRRFVEMEPGLYRSFDVVPSRDPFGDFRTIVFDRGPLGHIVLMADGPMTYSKAPWHSTSSFTFLALILALVFIIGSLLYRAVAAIVRIVKRRKQNQPQMASIARWAAVLYSVLSLLFVAGLALTGQFDPVYGLPKAYFGETPAWSSAIDKLPITMTCMGIVLAILTVTAWWKSYWKTAARIHYTLFTAASLLLIWLFHNWNLL